MTDKGQTQLLPKLRFPEFRGAAPWKPISLGNTSTPVTERVGERKLTPVSISAGIGFVPQAEKFGRDISGKQYQLYTLVRDGDFVYNKGNSLKFPEGCVYLLQGWEQVAAPNVFICFRLKDGYSNGFFQNCFEANIHGKQLKRHITSGARSNGLLNISKDAFLGVQIPTPSWAEQQKIADCLSSLDELISALARKVDALKTHKKGLMRELFPREGETQPRLRFPKFAGDWEINTLKQVCKMKAGKFISAAEIKSEELSGFFPCYGGNGLRGYTETHTHEGTFPLIGRQGALCGNVKLAKGQFYATEHAVVVSPRADVNTAWLYYLLDLLNLNQFATGQAQPGLSVDVLNALIVAVPKQEGEQHRIADSLTSLDILITAATQELETLKTHKKGLMQQVFPSAEAVEA